MSVRINIISLALLIILPFLIFQAKKQNEEIERNQEYRQHDRSSRLVSFCNYLCFKFNGCYCDDFSIKLIVLRTLIDF